MKKNDNIINFRSNDAISRKLATAMEAMKTNNQSAVLTKALELGLDLLDVSNYEPTRFLMKMSVPENKGLVAVPGGGVVKAKSSRSTSA